MRRYPRIPLFFLFLSSLSGTVGVLRPDSISARAQVGASVLQEPSQWNITPLLRIGDPAPEVGGKFEEIGESFWLDPGVIVFWARYGLKEWALFSMKGGTVRLVFPEGKQVRPGNSDAREPLDIQRKLGFSRVGTYLNPSGSLLYVSVFGNMKGEHGSVYAWDGERLRRVLTRADTMDIGGVPYSILHVNIMDCSDGWALLHYETVKPRQVAGLALTDGTSLFPLVREDENMPGLRGVAIKNPMRLGYGLASAAVVPGEALVVLRVKGATYPAALFRLSPGKAERLLTVGEAHPLRSMELIQSIRIQNVASAKTFALEVGRPPAAKGLLADQAGNQLQRIDTVICHGANFCFPVDENLIYEQFYKSVVNSTMSPIHQFVPTARGTFNYLIPQIGFLREDPLCFAALITAEQHMAMPKSSKINIWQTTDLWLSDGQTLKNFSPHLRMNSMSGIWKLRRSRLGLIIHAVWGGIDNSDLSSAREESWWLLDPENPEKLLSMTDFPNDQGVRMEFKDILGWNTLKDLVFFLKDGIYRAIRH